MIFFKKNNGKYLRRLIESRLIYNDVKEKKLKKLLYDKDNVEEIPIKMLFNYFGDIMRKTKYDEIVFYRVLGRIRDYILDLKHEEDELNLSNVMSLYLDDEEVFENGVMNIGLNNVINRIIEKYKYFDIPFNTIYLFDATIMELDGLFNRLLKVFSFFLSYYLWNYEKYPRIYLVDENEKDFIFLGDYNDKYFKTVEERIIYDNFKNNLFNNHYNKSPYTLYKDLYEVFFKTNCRKKFLKGEMNYEDVIERMYRNNGYDRFIVFIGDIFKDINYFLINFGDIRDIDNVYVSIIKVGGIYDDKLI